MWEECNTVFGDFQLRVEGVLEGVVEGVEVGKDQSAAVVVRRDAQPMTHHPPTHPSLVDFVQRECSNLSYKKRAIVIWFKNFNFLCSFLISWSQHRLHRMCWVTSSLRTTLIDYLAKFICFVIKLSCLHINVIDFNLIVCDVILIKYCSVKKISYL